MSRMYEIENLLLRYFVVSLFYLIWILVGTMVFLMGLFVFVHFPFLLLALIPIILAVYIAHVQIIYHTPVGYGKRMTK